MNLLISVQSGSLSEHIFLWLCSQPLIETLRSDGERIRGLDREGVTIEKEGATNRMSEQIPLLVLFSICALWKCLLLLSLLTRCAIVVIFSIADAIYIKFNWLENQIDSIRTAATTASTMDPTHICLWPGADCAWESPGESPKMETHIHWPAYKPYFRLKVVYLAAVWVRFWSRFCSWANVSRT